MSKLDSALVVAAREGSEEALEELFRTCGPRLLALIRVRLGPSLRRRVESRDILQSTLLKAFAAIDGLEAEHPGQLMAWLARIAEHEIRDLAAFHGRQRRDPRREQPLEEAPPAELADRVRSMSSRLVLDAELARLEAALEDLAPDHREVILLRYFSELSFPEIGCRMERSADAVRMLFARAMAALTARMEEAP